jgi:hypothetical protein
VLGLVVLADHIDDDVGVLDALVDGLAVAGAEGDQSQLCVCVCVRGCSEYITEV